MKKSRFNEEQQVRILREADRGQVAEVAKRHGISDQTIYIWRKRFGSMTPDDTRRLKALEGENGKLKKLGVVDVRCAGLALFRRYCGGRTPVGSACEMARLPRIPLLPGNVPGPRATTPRQDLPARVVL